MTEIYHEEQLSGIANIAFHLLTEVSNFPIQLTDQNSSQLVFAVNNAGLIATVDEESLSDDTKIKETASGDLHEISLKYNILTQSNTLEQLLDTYKNKPGIAIVSYYNGYKKIFGTNEEPLFMKFTPKQGSTVTDKSFVSVEIQGVTRNRAVFYSL